MAPARPNRSKGGERQRVRIATWMWVAFLLGVTLQRSFPTVSPRWAVLAQGIAVITAFWVICVRSPQVTEPSTPRVLLAGFATVGLVAAGLAAFRGQPGDMVNHLASIMALVAAASLDRGAQAKSSRGALLYVVSASIVLGAIYPPAVQANERGFLRPLYDGRLVGFLGTPNLLGQCAVLLIVISLVAFTGSRRNVGIGVALFAIVGASSQTALATAVGVILVYATVRLWLRGMGPLLVVAGLSSIAGVIGVLFVLGNQAQPVTLTTLASKVTLSARVDIWQFLLRQHIPFTGLGQSTLAQLFENNVIQGAIGISSAHDILLDAYVRDGVLGVVALSVAVGAALYVIAKRRGGLALLPLAAFIAEGVSEVTPTHVPFLAFTLMAIVCGLPPRQGKGGPKTLAVTAPVPKLVSRT